MDLLEKKNVCKWGFCVCDWVMIKCTGYIKKKKIVLVKEKRQFSKKKITQHTEYELYIYI